MADETYVVGKWALIRESDNICVNLIRWDGDADEWQPPEGCYTVNIDEIEWYDIGASYSKDANKFTSQSTQ